MVRSVCLCITFFFIRGSLLPQLILGLKQIFRPMSVRPLGSWLLYLLRHQ